MARRASGFPLSGDPFAAQREATAAAGDDRSRAEQVIARVRAIPEGFVRSYGDVSPGAPRFAGTVLSQLPPDGDDVPWQRVVRADGSLAKGDRQRALLQAEGVPFRGERVDMRAARLPE